MTFKKKIKQQSLLFGAIFIDWVGNSFLTEILSLCSTNRIHSFDGKKTLTSQILNNCIVFGGNSVRYNCEFVFFKLSNMLYIL